MADVCRSFMDFRPLCVTKRNLQGLLPSKQLSSVVFFYSHGSRISRVKRWPLHLTLLSKPTRPISSSPGINLISTHEHSDGSIIFRFGDPSEIAKNVQMEESKVEQKEIERFLDGDHERDVKDSSFTDVNGELVGRQVIDIFEKESDSGEKFLEDSNEFELPGLVSNEEAKDSFTQGSNIENIASVEDGLNEENLEIENSTDTMESPEKIITVSEVDFLQASPETVVTTEVSSFSEHQSMEGEMQNDIVEDVTEGISVISLPPKLEKDIMLPKVAEDQNFQAGMQSGMIGSGSDINDIEEEAPQTVVAAQLSIDTEAQTSVNGTALPNETVEDGNKRDEIQLIPVSPRLEAGMKIDRESGNGTVKDCSDADAHKTITMLDTMPQTSILESESIEDVDNMKNGPTESSQNYVTELEPAGSTMISQETQMTDFFLSCGAALLPHPSKVLTGGEDDYFVTGQVWLGVADGVGQWSLEGTKPGVYAQELIKNCEKLATDFKCDSVRHPVELLRLSVAETQSPGSSTVLIAQLVGQVLHVANIGDSGFIILRHGSVYKRSVPMLRAFHFPLLIERGDVPSNLAEFHKIDLEEEDVIIIATDGLFDNLYDQEIASEIMKLLQADKKLEEIAKVLATKAQAVGKSASVRSPFADNAQAAGYAGYTGGNLDDVTVIVAVVHRRSGSQTS